MKKNTKKKKKKKTTDFCLSENKGADQLCSKCTADPRICFRFTGTTISVLLKCEISSL